ncbi:hypothetical protein D9758_001679 [Tetrapyrgos nigripes]|uniref:Uncharacterized protein n=1 Tax=Tetrapyrgos nigripes TaxID=182062 RepID=A0A8H5GX75_9AGAR|nr:hypothetical protein D9758_001679 [Tetrapyrgos nigripes]
MIGVYHMTGTMTGTEIEIVMTEGVLHRATSMTEIGLERGTDLANVIMTVAMTAILLAETRLLVLLHVTRSTDLVQGQDHLYEDLLLPLLLECKLADVLRVLVAHLPPPSIRAFSPTTSFTFKAFTLPRVFTLKRWTKRSDRGSEISARHEGLSPVSPNPEPEIMTKAHTDQRSQTPALPSVENKEVIDSQRHEDVAIKHEHEPAMDAPFDPPLSRGSQTPSYHPPQQDGKEDKSMPDAEGDIVMKSEPEPPPSISMPVPLPTKPRGNSSPPRQPRWHDTRGGHPPTQPRHHWQRGRGAPFRGFPYDPPRAPRNHPIAASGMSQASPVQTATPNLPTPAPAPDGAAVTNDPFANIPEPIIPDYKSLLKLSPETETKVQELDALRKQIALQQKHAFNLTLEFGNIHKTTRRALHEFEMSTFDLRAAMARRKSTATQLELARAGMLGIDFEGDFSREGSTES